MENTENEEIVEQQPSNSQAESVITNSTIVLFVITLLLFALSASTQNLGWGILFFLHGIGLVIQVLLTIIVWTTNNQSFKKVLMVISIIVSSFIGLIYLMMFYSVMRPK